MLDSHSHSKNSHDGRETLLTMAKTAERLGLTYFAVTEHYDKDCEAEQFSHMKQLDIEAYKKDYEAVKKTLAGDMYFAFGIECGYSETGAQKYKTELPKHDFDVIINSVHVIDGADPYCHDFFRARGKAEAYSLYLDAVRKSVLADFDFDIVGHIGYACRYAPYADRALLTEETREGVDAVLRAVIERGKSLEVNSAVKNLPFITLPEPAIIKRFCELGGKNISFGADAHDAARIAEGYGRITEMLKELGFTHFTVYKKRKPYKIPF